MSELPNIQLEEKEDGSFLLTWDDKDPSLAFLNGKTEKDIITMIENGLKTMEENKIDKPDAIK
jgi:hypothetical protein